MTPQDPLRTAAEWLVNIHADSTSIPKGSALWEDLQSLKVALALPPRQDEPGLRDWQRDLLTFDADDLAFDQVVANLLGVKSVNLRTEQDNEGNATSEDRRWRVQYFGGTFGGTLKQCLDSALRAAPAEPQPAVDVEAAPSVRRIDQAEVMFREAQIGIQEGYLDATATEPADASEAVADIVRQAAAAGTLPVSPDKVYLSRTEPADGLRKAASRYRASEWAARIHEDEPRTTPEHNARVEEWRAADAALASMLGELSPYPAAATEPADGTLDEAWAAAEAALSEGWGLTVWRTMSGDVLGYGIEARVADDKYDSTFREWSYQSRTEFVHAVTLAGAFLALAARLRVARDTRAGEGTE